MLKPALPSRRRSYAVPLLCGLGLLFGCQHQPSDPNATASQDAVGDEALFDTFGNGRGGSTIEFADLAIFFEFNSTDNDLGVQVALDAVDWRRVRARNPHGIPILDITAGAELKELGLTELRFESAEPSPQEVLDLFAPGDYAFSGITVDGDKLQGTATLSLALPPAPTIISPEEDEVVDASDVTIEWSPIPGVASFEVIVSNEDTGASLEIELSGSATSLVVPEAFVEAGSEYKVEVLSIAANGNKTITESVFFTAP